MVKLRVAEILKEQNRSHYWLQKQLDGMCYRNYMRMVRGETQSIRFEILDRLSDILNVTVGDLFEKTENDRNISD